MSPAGYNHGAVVGELTWRLGQHVASRKLGQILGAETGFILQRNPDTVRAPDIAFVRKDRSLFATRPKNFAGEAPNLAVEVLSPNDQVSDVDDKITSWLSAGCESVWVVNPNLKTVTVHHAAGDVRAFSATDELVDETVVPGFRCAVADLFADA